MARMRSLFRAGGLVAGVLLIVAGALWIYMGASARSDVKDTISREGIVGTPDMRPEDVPAGLLEDPPTCDVADEPIDSGSEALCFAEYMRVHALEGTGGKTFAEMGRFLNARGEDVFTEEEAAVDPRTGEPVSNPQRDLWVTQRALATGMELAYMGDRLALFSIGTGVLFVIIGVGLLVMILAGGVLATPARESG